MTYRKFTLKAGKPIQVPVSGKVILVDDTGAAEGVDITPMRGTSELTKMPKRQKAFKCFEDYDAIVLEAAVDCTVALFLSQTDVSLGFASGALVNVRGDVSILNDPDNPVPVGLLPGAAVTVANGAANRIPVDIGGGTVAVTADNVGVNNANDKPVPMQFQALASLVNNPALVVNNVAAAVPADATLKRAYFRNASANGARIALGGAGVTMAAAAIILQPGDMWAETDAAGAAWYAVADIAGAELRVLGVKP